MIQVGKLLLIEKFLIKRYKNMDNNQTWHIKDKSNQDMQNWKKQILMDPVLDTLFDGKVSAEQFLNKKILPLSYTQIAGLYSKLSTINFQLSQNIQKQVETKAPLIQKSYFEFVSYKEEIQTPKQTLIYKNKPQQNLNYLKNFNNKYETVDQSLVQWKNVTNCLHFAKGIQTYKFNVSMLKNLMRGYNGNEQTINPIKLAKMLKQLITINSRFNFNGIKFYENEKVLINSTKNIVYTIGFKNLPKLLQQHISIIEDDPSQKVKKAQIQKNIQQWIGALFNIGTLKEFVVNFGKSMLQQLAENIKKYIKNDLANISTNLEGNLYIFMVQSCKSLIFLEEKLCKMHKIQLTNVPNLFIKFWQKLCQFIRQTILWIKKDQQNRNPPKTREQALVWKYPSFYHSFSRVCSEVQIFLLENVLYNTYNFGKNKQRLMINCLLELAIQYHQQKQRFFTQIPKIVDIMSSSYHKEMKKQQKEQEAEIKLYLSSIEQLFMQSKNVLIYQSLMDSLCTQLDLISEQKNDQSLANRIKIIVKSMIKKHGKSFGIRNKHLASFKLLK